MGGYDAAVFDYDTAVRLTVGHQQSETLFRA